MASSLELGEKTIQNLRQGPWSHQCLDDRKLPPIPLRRHTSRASDHKMHHAGHPTYLVDESEG